MKIYYKIFFPTACSLFMAFGACIMGVCFVEKFSENVVESLPMLVFIFLFGLVAYFYGRRAWMRIRGIPVLELTDHEVIINNWPNRSLLIPYKSIVEINSYNTGIEIDYKDGYVMKSKSVPFDFVDADESNLDAIIAEVRDRMKVGNG